MLKKCVNNANNPLLFIESKVSYPKNLIQGKDLNGVHIEYLPESNNDSLLLELYPEEQSDVLIITYGGMSEVAANCVYESFISEEIIVTVLVLGSVKPLDTQSIVTLARKIGRILVLEEGCITGGWGAEVSSIIHERCLHSLIKPVSRLGSKDFPIPASMPMELEILPNLGCLQKKVVELAK